MGRKQMVIIQLRSVGTFRR